MDTELELYQGREQSLIKHKFLREYLQLLAFKVLRNRFQSFNFIDGLAGPWQVSDDSLSDTSFDQAVRGLKLVHEVLKQKPGNALRIRYCFCEQANDACDRLEAYAQEQKGLNITVFRGAFENNLKHIASICQDGFTFTFIDPTGWNIRSDLILKFLHERDGEFILNFMSEHINRHAEYSPVSQSFGHFLADSEWEKDFNSLPTNLNNEERILILLKQKIKDARAAKYVADCKILKPRENRVKMRLVFGTNSSKGLEVFRDVQSKIELLEYQTRNKINRGPNSQSLFPDEEFASLQQQSMGVGCPEFLQQAELQIRKFLLEHGPSSFQVISTNVLEQVPVRLKQVNDLVKKMKNNGIISFQLPPRKHVPRPNTEISLVE